MEKASFFVGLAAVFFFLLCYQFRERKTIIVCNVISRVLYILQYLLLAAFEGAAMDISAIPSSVLAARKHTPFVQKHKAVILIVVNGIVIALGLLAWQDWLSWVPVVGVLVETNALWLSKEKDIRLLSLAALPFWLFYNLRCGAYGSAIGNVLVIVSIVSAMLRYDFPGRKKE